MKDLIKIRPAVRTIPPIAHETLSPTGMSLAHLWKSRTSQEVTPLNVGRSFEEVQESEIESKLAFPP
jgi:hypothetical protein